MARVEIIGPKTHFFDVVSLIHDLGTLHIEDLTKKIQSGEMPLETMEVYDRQRRDGERMEDQLIRVRAILRALHNEKAYIDPAARKKEYERLYAMDGDQLAVEVTEVIDEVEDRTATLASSHTSLEAELALLGRYEPILHKIQPLAKQIVTTGAYESVALLVERRYKGALEQLKAELDKLTHRQCEIVSTDVDEETTAVIVVFNRQYSEPVHKFLAMENVNQIRLPSEFKDVPFDVAYDQIKERRQSLPTDLQEVTSELEDMSNTWQLRLTTVRDVLTDKIDEISAIPKFGRTEYAFVITGWVPASEVKTVRKAIASEWGDEIIVEQTEIEEKDFGDTPVALSNPKAVSPFQNILSVYGVPRYGTLDPTMMLFIFFPLFMGMIVGDIGYGSVLLGITIWLRLKFKKNDMVQIATSILGPAATMIVVFGFIYGEFFGNLLKGPIAQFMSSISGGMLPFERTQADMITVFMYMAIGVGVIQILLGLIMGIINAVRTKSRKHLFEKGGILIFVVGIFLVVIMSVFAQNFGSWGIGLQILFALLALAGFFYAVRGGGVMGVIETLETFTGMASYIRIMAVGLAGAIFAEAINKIVAEMAQNTAMLVFAVLIGIVLHTLNFVIACFSPFIHAMRLNLLEFFGKFYETGNQMYSPFVKTGGEKRA